MMVFSWSMFLSFCHQTFRVLWFCPAILNSAERKQKPHLTFEGIFFTFFFQQRSVTSKFQKGAFNEVQLPQALKWKNSHSTMLWALALSTPKVPSEMDLDVKDRCCRPELIPPYPDLKRKQQNTLDYFVSVKTFAECGDVYRVTVTDWIKCVWPITDLPYLFAECNFSFVWKHSYNATGLTALQKFSELQTFIVGSSPTQKSKL